MIQNATKYANTTRTIAGTTNFVFDNDVVLLCDTSLGVVELTLLGIPQGNFSTQYKLYVVDKSNNALTNNITIKAPIGFTINNSANAIINVNNGVAIITISSDTTYNVSFNYSISGNSLIIKNENVIITPSATSIDFVGTPVTATAVGNDVTVNIALAFISVTYSALQTLIGSNSLIPSQQYLITDAIFINTAPIEQVSIVVSAMSTNEISLSGSGIFLNADYQSVGNYSGVIGFVTQTGIYSILGTYAIGEGVVYDNLNYVNISGLNTGFPNATPLDWSLLTKTSTNGYITEIDIIKYNVATNQITYREDVRNNRIENNLQTYTTSLYEAFKYFQWGNNNVNENTILAESFWDILNQSGQIFGNIVDNQSAVTRRSDNQGYIFNNKFILKSTVEIQNFGVIEENVFENVGDLLIIQTFAGTLISKNIFRYGTSCIVSNNSNSSVIQLNEFIHNLSSVDSYEINNFGGTINDNRFYQCRQIRVINNSGQIEKNSLEQGSTMNININTGSILNNVLTQSGSLQVTNKATTNNSGNINFNVIKNGLLQIEDGNSGDINVNVIDNARIILSINSSDINENNINKSDLLLTVNSGKIYYNNIINGSLLQFVNQNNLIANNFINQSTIILSSNLGVDFLGQFNNNEIIISTLTFDKGCDNFGLFNNNILLANSNLRATDIFTGNVEQNTFENSTWVFSTCSNSTTIISNNNLRTTNVITDYIIDNFIGNTLNKTEWIVAVNSAILFNYNNWTYVDFQPTSLTGDITFTNITEAFFNCSSFNNNVTGGIIQNGIGTTKYTLDMNDVLIYDPLLERLTIPLCLNTFFGYFELNNSSGKVIGEIINGSRRFPTRFRNNDLNTTMTFEVKNPVALATANELVYDVVGAYPISLQLDFNFGIKDYIEILQLTNGINIIQTYKHYL